MWANFSLSERKSHIENIKLDDAKLIEFLRHVGLSMCGFSDKLKSQVDDELQQTLQKLFSRIKLQSLRYPGSSMFKHLQSQQMQLQISARARDIGRFLDKNDVEQIVQLFTSWGLQFDAIRFPQIKHLSRMHKLALLLGQTQLQDSSLRRQVQTESLIHVVLTPLGYSEVQIKDAIDFHRKQLNTEPTEAATLKDPFQKKLLSLNFTVQHAKLAAKWRSILQSSLNLLALNDMPLTQLEANDHAAIRDVSIGFFELLHKHVNPDLSADQYKHYVKDYSWTRGEMCNSFKVLAALSRNMTLQSFAWPDKEEHFWAMQHSQELLFLTGVLEKRNLQFGLSLPQSQEVFAAVHAFTYEVVSRITLQQKVGDKMHLVRLERKGIMELNGAKVPAAGQTWLQSSLMCATLDRIEIWPVSSVIAHFTVPIELLFGGWFLNPHNFINQWSDQGMPSLNHHRLFGVNAERSLTFFAGTSAFLHQQQQLTSQQVDNFGPLQENQWHSDEEAELLLQNFGIVSYASNGRKVVSAPDSQIVKEMYEQFLKANNKHD